MNEGLLLRICFMHVEGATLAYMYGYESLAELDLKTDNEGAGYRFFEVGNTLTLMDEKYTIDRFNVAIEPTFFDINAPQYGISMYASDEKRSYNVTMNVWLK
jgi:hypothetical protein